MIFFRVQALVFNELWCLHFGWVKRGISLQHRHARRRPFRRLLLHLRATGTLKTSGRPVGPRGRGALVTTPRRACDAAVLLSMPDCWPGFFPALVGGWDAQRKRVTHVQHTDMCWLMLASSTCYSAACKQPSWGCILCMETHPTHALLLAN